MRKYYSKCNKCGKYQKPNDKTSNENWDVYDTVPCECGGRFDIVFEPEIV